jgi:hypothetical protein
MNDEARLVYFVLGAAGSGRREVLADLVTNGFTATAAPVVLLAAAETPDPGDDGLPVVGRWRWADDRLETDLPPGTAPVLILADGRGNPVDQIEALKPWLAAQGAVLGRILCVVNCQLAAAHPPLLAWYDACVHFADVVLLAKREGVANKWLSDFRNRYRDQFLPALFEFVKGGRVSNPALVIEPQPRRLSHYFDEEGDWLIDGLAEDDDTEVEEGTSEVEVTEVVDPYLARHPGGRRKKELPRISEFLEGV